MKRSHYVQYLQLAWKQTLKLLLQTECEGEPAHVGGLPALPEVHHTLEVLLGLFLLIITILFTLLFAHRFLLIILILNRYPVPVQSPESKH